jgi:hypothetical protein
MEGSANSLYDSLLAELTPLFARSERAWVAITFVDHSRGHGGKILDHVRTIKINNLTELVLPELRRQCEAASSFSVQR